MGPLKVEGRRFLALVIIVHILSLGVAATASWKYSVGSQGSVARWNPRKVPVNTEFVGDEVCFQCHKKQSSPHSQSPMGMAMQSVVEARVLTENPLLTFRNGPYSFSIKREEKQALYTVTDGKNTISLPILYAVGQGKAGQTYLLENEGQFYESRVSFYKELGGLDLTIGTPSQIPSSLKQAIGRVLTENEVGQCFGCHSTGGSSGGKLTLEKVVPGIGCEGCHGPGGPHVTAIQSGSPGGKLVFNPARLSGDELTQDFCASCHLGSPDFEELRKMKVNNVRFQPYRIFYSKCYSDDRRISCAACHDAHDAVNEDPVHYDGKCTACHSTQTAPTDSGGEGRPRGMGAQCKVATKDCVSCHMPKVEPPGAHFKFTDHYIRVVKAGEAYPN